MVIKFSGYNMSIWQVHKKSTYLLMSLVGEGTTIIKNVTESWRILITDWHTSYKNQSTETLWWK